MIDARVLTRFGTACRVGIEGNRVLFMRGRDPHAGDLYVVRGARGDLIKIVWHDGIGMSLYAKRQERGRFIWPWPADGTVAISASQLAYMLGSTLTNAPHVKPLS